MLPKRISMFLTGLNVVMCLSLLFIFADEETTIQAQDNPPDPFLEPVYYETAVLFSIFDHEVPIIELFGTEEADDCGDETEHATNHDGATGHGYGYSLHNGIDYDINYRPVRAAAAGTVTYAGWSRPSDHTFGLGLKVEIDHPDNENYATKYGHMSVIWVETGDMVEVEEIGISGNTGRSDGSHLHFELRNGNGLPVNPYGWDNQWVDDPWADWVQADFEDCDFTGYRRGATSHDLWLAYPSILPVGERQRPYPTGNPVVREAPVANESDLVIDNSDGKEHFVAGEQWSLKKPAAGAYEDSYHYATILGGSLNFSSRWHIEDINAGNYHLYAHIPTLNVWGDPPPTINPTHKAIYTVVHNGQEDQVIVVQSEYPNQTTGSWAYLGKYDFGSSGTQQISISRQSDAHSAGLHVIADAVTLDAECFPDTTTNYQWTAERLTPISPDVVVAWQLPSTVTRTHIYRSLTPDIEDATLMHTSLIANGQWVDENAGPNTLYYWLDIQDWTSTCMFQVSGPQEMLPTGPQFE